MEATRMDDGTIEENILRQCAEEFLMNHPEFNRLTAEQVLEHDACRKLIEVRVAEKAAKAKEDAEKETKQAEVRVKAERNAQLAAAEAALRAERKLSASEIKGNLSLVAASPPENPEIGGSIHDIMVRIPEAVLQLKQSHGNLLMGCVYKSANEAVLFRSLLISSAKKYHVVLREQGLESGYRDILKDISQRIQPLIAKTAEVISAWGLDPNEVRVNDSNTFYQIRSAAENDVRFSGMVNVITLEDIETAKAKEVAEQKRAANRVTVRGEIAAKFVTVGSSAKSADKIARSIIKKYFDDPNCEGVADKMIWEAAVNKLVGAQSDEDRAMVYLYVKAINRSAEELDKMAEKFRIINDQLSTVSKNRRQKPDYGAIKPGTIAAAASKKSGKNKKKGKKEQHPSSQPSGRKGRQSRDSK